MNEKIEPQNMSQPVQSEVETPKRSSSVVALERNLLRTSWVKEAELIQTFVPVEDLTKTQQKLLQKCIDKEEFTDKQLADLKLILNKYRKIIQEIKPQETVDTVETTVQMIQTEADFISMMEADEQKKLLVYVDTYQGKRGFDFIVLPVTDSRIIESLDMQVDLFRDYSLDEQLVYSKGSSGKELTHEEQAIYRRMREEIVRKQSTERIESMNSFLANQLILEGSSSTFEERLKFWSVFPFTSKVGIFIRVQDMLGLSEVKNSELFPTRR